jgi:hypothetical protein
VLSWSSVVAGTGTLAFLDILAAPSKVSQQTR